MTKAEIIDALKDLPDNEKILIQASNKRLDNGTCIFIDGEIKETSKKDFGTDQYTYLTILM